MLPEMKTLRFAVMLAAAGIACALALPVAAQSAPASQAQTAPAMKTWFIRLIPPRSTFMQDMTESERKLMEEHFVYWKDLFAKGACLFGGPVLDPKGVYGVLVVKAASEDEARALGITLDQIQAWEPEVKAKGKRGRKTREPACSL